MEPNIAISESETERSRAPSPGCVIQIAMRVCVLAFSLLPACLSFQHQTIEPLRSGGISVEERLAEYDRLRTRSVGRYGDRFSERIVGPDCPRDQRSGYHLVERWIDPSDANAQFAERKDKRMVTLGSGQLVDDPRDLLPIVGEGTKTASAARRFEEIFADHQRDQRIATGLMLGSIGVLGAGLAGAAADLDPAIFVSAFIAGVVANFIGLPLFFSDPQPVYSARYQVFRSYSGDLLNRLDLCSRKIDDKEEIFPCGD